MRRSPFAPTPGWICLFVALSAACNQSRSSTDAGAASGADASATDGAGADADVTPDAGVEDALDAGACTPEIELVVFEQELGPARVYAKALHDGEEVALLVDTASQVTFLTTPPGTPDQLDYDRVMLGCELRSIAGRAISAAEESDEAGLPVIGFLGADYFQEAPTRLDLSGRRITRIALDEIQRNAVPVSYLDVYGYMFVDVAIDGVDLRLGFDTGAPHALWIGVDGLPGDVPVQSQDGYGNPITLYLGTGELVVNGADPAEIPVLRILEHASIEDSNELIGVDAQGLFGLTSLPGPSFVVDSASRTVWLE